MMIDRKKLVDEALAARLQAYSPYSNFCVGAALLCADGEIIRGANVENSSYGGTICAERSALCAAISQGKREFSAIAIVGAHKDKDVDAICAPCGICRQFISEFTDRDFEVILFDGEAIKAYTIEELLPASFGRSDLQR